VGGIRVKKVLQLRRRVRRYLGLHGSGQRKFVKSVRRFFAHLSQKEQHTVHSFVGSVAMLARSDTIQMREYALTAISLSLPGSTAVLNVVAGSVPISYG